MENHKKEKSPWLNFELWHCIIFFAVIVFSVIFYTIIIKSIQIIFRFIALVVQWIERVSPKD